MKERKKNLQSITVIRKEEIFKQREEQLRARDVEIQESLVRFSKFLQENEAKKIRNINRKEQEEDEIALKNEEFNSKTAELETLKAQLENVNKTVAILKKYHDFLEEVRKKHLDEFKEVEDILTRCITLQSHKNDMAKAKLQLEKEIENTSQIMNKNRKNYEVTIFNLETTISSLREEIEHREKMKQERTKEMSDKSKKIINITAELGQLLLSIDNIENRCKSRYQGKRGIVKLSKEANFSNFSESFTNAKKQLGDIEAYLDDYKKIIDMVEEKKKVVLSTTKPK